jgi:phenylacetate-CoA ligase
MASLKGYYLNKIRYDQTTQKRISLYLERETWSKSDWAQWQESAILKILREAKKFVPYYRNFWKGNAADSDDLHNWPVINKEIINKSPQQFINEKYKISSLFVDHTSGTTGTPLNIYMDYETVKEQYAFFQARVKEKYSIRLSDKWAIIGAQRVTPVDRVSPPFWVYNYAGKQLYFSSLHISDKSAALYLNAFRKYQPQFLIGYTNSINEIAAWMSQHDKIFPLKAVITNAEPIFDFQKENIEKAFQCPAVETFGQAELVCFANTFPDEKIYESPDIGFSEVHEVTDLKEGKFGKLIATGLLNKAMPFIRYDTNDMISEKYAFPEKGLPVFGKILGRKDDILRLKDGRKIVQIDGIFSSELGLQYGQIIQQDYSDFKIKIVPNSHWKEDNIDVLKERLKERVGNVQVSVEICESIGKTWAGKFRVIKSNLST